MWSRKEVNLYKTILVPLDGSKRAESILRHVEELAYRFEAKVVFLQVVESPHFIFGPEEGHGANMELYKKELERNEKEGKVYLTALSGKFREKGIHVEIRLVHGPIVEAIMNTAEAADADLIALASHGRSGLSQVFYGSVAVGVLHRVDRPLLLIRS
jgi:nucleotide-binding universal stress UspA family protein